MRHLCRGTMWTRRPHGIQIGTRARCSAHDRRLGACAHTGAYVLKPTLSVSRCQRELNICMTGGTVMRFAFGARWWRSPGQKTMINPTIPPEILTFADILLSQHGEASNGAADNHLFCLSTRHRIATPRNVPQIKQILGTLKSQPRRAIRQPTPLTLQYAVQLVDGG